MPDEHLDLINDLKGLDQRLFQSDFLHTWKQSADDLKAVLTTAELLELAYERGIATRPFQSGLAVSIFRDQSTRTRYAFAAGANLLGLGLQELDEKKSQIAHGETVRETAQMISFLTETVGIRDDMFLGEGHTYMAEVAAAVQQGAEQGVLPQRPSVINLQCDLDHPTQSLSDLLHLKTRFGSLESLRSKKIAMTWAYSPSYGKPLSVPQGIITLLSRFGMEVSLAFPAGYDLVPETMESARAFAGESGGSFSVVGSMKDAFAGADIVYPKSWAPYDVMKERTRLLKGGRQSDLDDLEKRCLGANAEHRDWECNDEMMSVTRNADAAYLHCLPADITDVSCEAGEVSASVFEKARQDTYREASHKPFVIAAMILLTRFEDPVGMLGRVFDNPSKRRSG